MVCVLHQTRPGVTPDGCADGARLRVHIETPPALLQITMPHTTHTILPISCKNTPLPYKTHSQVHQAAASEVPGAPAASTKKAAATPRWQSRVQGVLHPQPHGVAPPYAGSYMNSHPKQPQASAAAQQARTAQRYRQLCCASCAQLGTGVVLSTHICTRQPKQVGMHAAPTRSTPQTATPCRTAPYC